MIPVYKKPTNMIILIILIPMKMFIESFYRSKDPTNSIKYYNQRQCL